MSYSDTELATQERMSFGKSQITTISKTDFLINIKTAIEKGGEISWFSTDSHSFEWAEINTNTKKFLKNLERTLDNKIVDVGMFYPETKETTYNSYKIN